MIGAGSMEFAHARIWARHGRRPAEALWRRIETTRELAAVIDLVRGSALAGWIEGLGAGAGLHAMEATLRRHWRERVAEVVSWMPAAWAPAIEWCAVLADLPALQHLQRGGEPLPWMTQDERLAPLLERRAAGAGALPGGLEGAQGEAADLLDAWRAEWLRRLPHAGGRGLVEARLLPMLADHASHFAAPQPVDGWALRRTLQTRLSMLLRAAPVEPVAAFVYLALSALECERLRGELLRRAAFPHRWVAP